MSSFRETLKECHCHELQAAVESAGGRFLCYTRLDGDSWVVGASDGYDVWTLKMDEEEVDVHRDLAGTTVLDAYLTKIRNAFKTGTISLAESGKTINLSLGRASQAIDFGLFEAKAADKRVELQHILFRLADKVSDLDTRLDKAEKTVESLRQQRGAGSSGAAAAGLVDLAGDGKKKGPPRAPTKQAGMSVINPGSRKRKAARGVEFD